MIETLKENRGKFILNNLYPKSTPGARGGSHIAYAGVGSGGCGSDITYDGVRAEGWGGVREGWGGVWGVGYIYREREREREKYFPLNNVYVEGSSMVFLEDR